MIVWYGHLLGQGASGVVVIPTYQADFGDLVPVDASAGVFEVLLPAIIASSKGKRVIIVNDSGSTTEIIISSAGSDTINGGSSVSITSGRGAKTCWSDGSDKWFAY